ncbi:uncharacterized protein LOC124620242 [Schistocerca americana]|uniref:uncharacterized protein LOC124620242 n=1 Tax=Schistocerca americana TaxID=7009 RepID=UPI001F4F32AE|nr:uncharacterized protein LOC124620242 [Schistocerca americana]
MDIERLINSVRERSVLWEQKNKYYHNRDFVRQAWNEIAEDCGTDSEALKNKWKHLRDTFRSELKKPRAECSGDEGGMPHFQSNWPWYELMTFLTDIMTPRKTNTNVHHSKRTASQHDDAHDDVPFSPALTEKQSVSPDGTNQARFQDCLPRLFHWNSSPGEAETPSTGAPHQRVSPANNVITPQRKEWSSCRRRSLPA